MNLVVRKGQDEDVRSSVAQAALRVLVLFGQLIEEYTLPEPVYGTSSEFNYQWHGGNEVLTNSPE